VKVILQRFLNGVLSLIMTFLVMASPVAAIIYATEPAVVTTSFNIGRTPLSNYVSSFLERLEGFDSQDSYTAEPVLPNPQPSYALKKPQNIPTPPFQGQ